MRRLAIFAATVSATLLLAALAAGTASAAFGINSTDVTFTNEDGSPVTQAGSHPFAMTTKFGVNTVLDPEAGLLPEGEIKNLMIEQITGLAGNPTATPRCSGAEFAEIVPHKSLPSCANSTAVGIAGISAEFDPLPSSELEFIYVPVYNLVPPPGVAAELGFVVLGVPVTVDVGVSNKPPYNIVATLKNVSQALLFYGSELTLWGNPADSVHDAFRGNCLDPVNFSGEPVSLGNCPVNIAEDPFLTLPRSCQGPLKTIFNAESWQGLAAEPVEAVTHDGSIPPNPLGMTGCSKVGFGPTIAAQPTTSSARALPGSTSGSTSKTKASPHPTASPSPTSRRSSRPCPKG